MLWNDLVDMSCLKKFAEAFGVGGTTAKIKKHTDNEVIAQGHKTNDKEDI